MAKSTEGGQHRIWRAGLHGGRSCRRDHWNGKGLLNGFGDFLNGRRLLALRGPTPTGLARSIAVLASAPAVEGLILEPGALIDLQGRVWQGAVFTAFLLGDSEIGEVELPAPYQPVRILSATPITATEAAWVRLKGADAMREAWQQDGVDVLDQRRRAAEPRA